MAGDSDLVEQAMQLANYFIDLLGQVTSIHGAAQIRRREQNLG